jgi:hypothetical protein
MKKILVLLVALTASQAQAVDLGVLAGLDFSSRSVDPAVAGTTYSGGTSLGGGVFIQGALIPSFTWELNALVHNRKMKSTTGTTQVTDQITYFNFPIIARFWLGDFLSVGAGPYLALTSGNAVRETKTPVSSTTVEQSAGAMNMSSSDFGLLASGQLKLGLAPGMSLLVDVRYVLGLTDVDTTAASSKWSDVQALAGLSFGF